MRLVRQGWRQLNVLIASPEFGAARHSRRAPMARRHLGLIGVSLTVALGVRQAGQSAQSCAQDLGASQTELRRVLLCGLWAAATRRSRSQRPVRGYRQDTRY